MVLSYIRVYFWCPDLLNILEPVDTCLFWPDRIHFLVFQYTYISCFPWDMSFFPFSFIPTTSFSLFTPGKATIPYCGSWVSLVCMYMYMIWFTYIGLYKILYYFFAFEMYPRCTSNPQFPLAENVPLCPLKSIYPLFWWWCLYIYKLIASTNNAVINMLIQASSFTSARIFLRMSVPKNAELWYLLFWLNSSRLLSRMEKAMAPHSSTLAWKIPWMEEPGRLQSMGMLRVRDDWGTSLSLFTFMHWRRKWQPTLVFLPGESQGQGSLVGCRLRGRTESDTTGAT